MRRFTEQAVALLLTFLTTPVAAQSSRGAPPARPSLVVFLTVDQMRSDYRARWSGQLTGGLARFRQHGAIFANGVPGHAVTAPAPGHALTRWGRFPRALALASAET